MGQPARRNEMQLPEKGRERRDVGQKKIQLSVPVHKIFFPNLKAFIPRRNGNHMMRSHMQTTESLIYLCKMEFVETY